MVRLCRRAAAQDVEAPGVRRRDAQHHCSPALARNPPPVAGRVVWRGELDVQAGGDISALAAGDAELAAGEGRATLTGSLVAEAGDDVSLTGGGEFSLNVRSGSVSSGEGLEVAARSLDVQGRDGLTATGNPTASSIGRSLVESA